MSLLDRLSTNQAAQVGSSNQVVSTFAQLTDKTPELKDGSKRRVTLRFRDGKLPTYTDIVPLDSNAVIKVLIESRDFQEYAYNWLETIQNQVIRKLLDSGAVNFNETDYGLEAIKTQLEGSSTGERLTKEQITAWFERVLETPLVNTLAAKQGVEMSDLSDSQLSKIAQSCEKFKSMIAALAGGKTHYSEDVTLKLLKLFSLEDVNEDTLGSVGKKVKLRLERMLQKPDETEDLDAL